MKKIETNIFHNTCFACGSKNKHGLKLKFQNSDDGCFCQVSIPARYQSYNGVIHGGIIATMLDAAMFHCLREECGDAPVTCRLEVRYLQAVPPDNILTIKAHRKGKRGKIFLSDSELYYMNICYARARGAFIITNT
jgi:acyl-coenzyme A thioesterase PaaI-like protein